MRRILRTPLLFLVLILTVPACSAEGFGRAGALGTTIVASSPGALGPGNQRLLLVVADDDQQLVGGPDLTATAHFSFDGEEQGSVPTEWVWGIPQIRGFYVATAFFDQPGLWEVWLETADGTSTVTPFQVGDSPVVPEVGEIAPASPTRTLGDWELAELTTDPQPQSSFYETSVRDAVRSGRPSVIVFATPAFCQTAVCGPVLDLIKRVSADHPGAQYVHVEIYENIGTDQGELVEVPAVEDWGLVTEPWVFVVDADGLVSARFEGTIGAEELERALADVGA